MARRPKQGIEFAGWSVDIFDGDTKIDKLLDAQGWIGFGIYFYLCQMAYKFDGYFYRWAYDDSASTARRMGGGVGSKTVEETVRYCLQIGLFDTGLFDRVGILTSKGIQRRFLAATQRRIGKSVISDYWLLDDEESIGLEKCASNDDSCDKKGDSCDDNPHLSDIYLPESRVEESIDNNINKGAVADYLNRINPMASPTSLQLIAAYEKSMGTDVCIRAFDIALDEKKVSWSYIRTILQSWESQDVKCIADLEAVLEKRQKEKGYAKDGKATSSTRDSGESKKRWNISSAQLD